MYNVMISTLFSISALIKSGCFDLFDHYDFDWNLLLIFQKVQCMQEVSQDKFFTAANVTT